MAQETLTRSLEPFPCYKWHAGLLWVAYCIVRGAIRAVMHGVLSNDRHGKPTMGPDDDGRSGG